MYVLDTIVATSQFAVDFATEGMDAIADGYVTGQVDEVEASAVAAAFLADGVRKGHLARGEREFDSLAAANATIDQVLAEVRDGREEHGWHPILSMLLVDLTDEDDPIVLRSWHNDDL